MIYLDNAATTPVSKEVKHAIFDVMDYYGNPSSDYDFGRTSKKMLNSNRHVIEDCLNLPRDSFIFTSCGSESDNAAIKLGFQYGLSRSRNKIVISSVEHHAVSHAAEQMKAFGAKVEYVNVLQDGKLDIDDLKNKVDSKTAIVSIMASNNETGTIMDIYAAAEIAHRFGALFHTDAVQGITHMPIIAKMVDMFSISGHKFNVPKGIGGLYIEPHIRELLNGTSLISGGRQEFNVRAGTENLPYIMGLAIGVAMLTDNLQTKNNKLIDLHNYATGQIRHNFPYAKINGPTSVKEKNPAIINVSLGYADAASVVEWTSMYDVCISSGSACNTGSNKPSHVLTAMGLSEKEAFSSIRISMSEHNTFSDIDMLISVLKLFERRYKMS